MKLRSKYTAVILGVAGAAFIGLSAARADSSLNDLYPASPPEAVSDFEHLGGGQPGEMSELYPASQPEAVSKTRQQVQDELDAATRSGAIRVYTDPSGIVR